MDAALVTNSPPNKGLQQIKNRDNKTLKDLSKANKAE